MKQDYKVFQSHEDKNYRFMRLLAAVCTLLYGYSLIIAKNFVTVYTAFDYLNRFNLL